MLYYRCLVMMKLDNKMGSYYSVCIMESDFTGPVNIGSEEMIAINDLVKMVAKISGKDITIKNIPGPTGVRGRNSDNKLIREKLGWAPTALLHDGMSKTFNWIVSQMQKKNNTVDSSILI